MQKIVWVTGASTGIGASLAVELAKRGYSVAATARSGDKIEALIKDHSGVSGKIMSYPGDLTDAKKMKVLVKKIIKEQGGIDIAVLNAGTYLPDTAENFTAENFEKQFDVNVLGTARTLDPILKYFFERKQGHVVLVASVAGFRGLPKSLSYGPSKAALINMAEALAIEGRDHNIKVQLANPGFIKTPLTDKNDFDMPMLMEAEDAARVFADGLESSKFEITFPWAFVYLKKLIDLLPNRLYLWLMHKGTKGRSG